MRLLLQTWWRLLQGDGGGGCCDGPFNGDYERLKSVRVVKSEPQPEKQYDPVEVRPGQPDTK